MFKIIKTQKNSLLLFSCLVTALASSFTSAQTVYNMQKINTDFSIDGDHGAVTQQQVYLWQTDLENVNQQWIEIDRGDDFYTYQKIDTDHCLDGGNGGDRRQAVILWPCDATNQNQHWQKVSTANNSFRLEKRNAPGFSIDGDHGATFRQPIYLWNSDGSNVNQQWVFFNLGEQPENELPDGLHPDITRILDIPTSPRTPQALYSDSYSVGDRCYCETTFDHDIGPVLVDTPVGTITVEEACAIIGPGPGSDGRPVYNDVQCGNGPANTADDETFCPGRTDIGREGCDQAGPLWNFN